MIISATIAAAYMYSKNKTSTTRKRTRIDEVQSCHIKFFFFSDFKKILLVKL